MLLSLGMGIAKASSRSPTDDDPLLAFGLVALASLCPVVTVQLLGLILFHLKPLDVLIAENIAYSELTNNNPGAAETSPLRQFVYGFRAILPSMTALLILLAVLRQPLPAVTFEELVADDVAIAGPAASDIDELVSIRAESEARSLRSPSDQSPRELRSSSNASRSFRSPSNVSVGDKSMRTLSPERLPLSPSSLPAHPKSVISRTDGASADQKQPPMEMSSVKVVSSPPSTESLSHTIVESVETSLPRRHAIRRCLIATWLQRNWVFLFGILLLQVGIILFNFGIDYGFAVLGQQGGALLPTAFLETPGASPNDTPIPARFAYGTGMFVVLFFTFLLALMTTHAEPALYVFAKEVQLLTGGRLPSLVLISTVSLGVGAGLIVAVLALVNAWSIGAIMVATRLVSVLGNIILLESSVAVAWDSAGITTGPVTVPFVLSLGLGFGLSMEAGPHRSGFGLIACVSAFSVLAVMMGDLLMRSIRWYRGSRDRGRIQSAPPRPGRSS